MQDPLRQLLKQADNAVDAPVITRVIANRVRRKYRTQQFVRATAAAVIIIALGILAIKIPRVHDQPIARSIPPQPQPQHLTETDARVDEMVAEILEKHAAKAAAHAAPEADEYLWQLSEQRNQAALILVRSADRIYEQSHDRPAAEASYRLAIQLFPNSPAAMTAQHKLQSLAQKGTES